MTALGIAAVAFSSVVGIVAVTIALIAWEGDERRIARALLAIGIVTLFGAALCWARIFGVRM